MTMTVSNYHMFSDQRFPEASHVAFRQHVWLIWLHATLLGPRQGPRRRELAGGCVPLSDSLVETTNVHAGIYGVTRHIVAPLAVM
jgi:hypothetical protein